LNDEKKDDDDDVSHSLSHHLNQSIASKGGKKTRKA